MRLSIVTALLASSALAPAAMAQNAPAPRFVSVDQNGVDLTSTLVTFSLEEGGIGSGPGRVSMQRIWAQEAGWVDNWSGGLFERTVGGTTKTYIQIAGISDVFTKSGSVYTSDNAAGSSLQIAGSNYVYTASNGTKITFSPSNIDATAGVCPGANAGTCQIPVEIKYPSGLKFTLTWHAYSQYRRLVSVASSAGYSLSIVYIAGDPASGAPPTDWYRRSSVTFSNAANPPSPAPVINYAYPNATTLNVTDPANRTWVFTLDGSGRLSGIRRPGSGSDNIAYGYNTSFVTSATTDGLATTYTLVNNPLTGQRFVTAQNPLNQTTVTSSPTTGGRPTSFRDELNRTWSFQYDSNDWLTKATAPEGNYTQYAYDSRGNVTTSTNVAKSGSGLSNIVTSASFDGTCANVVKCNKPNSTTDAKGNVTDYTYDTTHGGLTSIKLAAPSVGADRPEARFSYTQMTSQQGDLVYMLTGTSTCASGTSPSCIGTASEKKASATYNSNLLATSTSLSDGTNALVAASSMTYDPRGNLLTVDGPLTGVVDTIAFKYDSADQLVGTISPDPDGAGSLNNRALRLTYRSDGQISKQELGNTTGQSDSNFTAMTVSQTIDVVFDSNSRPVTSKLSAGGNDFALTQTSYDALGRVDCNAVRMNPAIYSSLPSSACSLGTEGSFGPDRISQLVYDPASEVTQLKVAVGTSDAANERTLTWSNNGMLATLKDAENNLTTYVYDGFDRPSQTQFPSSTKGLGNEQFRRL
jgi:YD repeat-containing protein